MTTTEPMTTVTVKVTREDIDNGVEGKCYSCPVALALKRVVFFARVDLDAILIYGDADGHNEFNVDMPRPVASFIFLFDAGLPASPFEFTIEVPARFVRAA